MKKDRQDADLKENKKASMRGIEERAVEMGKKARTEVMTSCAMIYTAQFSLLLAHGR